jgi:hypothetical protein
MITTLTNLYVFIKNNGLLDDADPNGANTIQTKMNTVIEFNSYNEVKENKGLL